MRIELILCLLLGVSAAGAESNKNKEDEKKQVKEIIEDNKEKKFSLHLPNYIIGGEDDLKLQMSFKYRWFKETPFFFEFSQKMFWNIYDDSKPFRDINYHPGLFYRYLTKGSWVKSLDFGYLHSSNGKAGVESRSFDQIYIRTSSLFELKRLNLLGAAEVFHTYNEDSLNDNIVDYIGFYKLIFLLNKPLGLKHFDLGVKLFAGKKLLDFDKGAFELNLGYTSPSNYFNPKILLQYYKGYAENLLEYKKKTESIRLGLLFYI